MLPSIPLKTTHLYTNQEIKPVFFENENEFKKVSKQN
jgi:hypothetical protein